MNAGIDTDFLIALTVEGHESRSAACTCRDVHLDRGGRFVLTSQVISEFLHVVTDHRRFEEPMAFQQALAKAREWCLANEVVHLSTSKQGNLRFLQRMSDERLGRKRILDTLLATTLLESGVSRLITGNATHYRIFEDLEVLDFRTFA